MNNIAYLPSAQSMGRAAPDMQAAQPKAEPYKEPYELGDFVAMFEDAEEATNKPRALSERCRDYYDNKQLTVEETAELKARGQPEIVRNQIKAKVNFWLGFETQTRSDPKAESEHGTTEDAASDATDMLRFQERRNDLDQKFSDCWENMLIEGYCGVEVLGPSKRDKRVMEVKLWSWDRLFYDPASAKHDFSDATYKGGVLWMDDKQARRRWKDKTGAIESSVTSEISLSTTYDDKPKQQAWATRNGKRIRVRIVQMYYECDGAWHWCIFTKGGVLESGKVEFTDEQGNPVCPMILQALYVDRDNNRYGEVAEFLWTQDEINKYASKSLHLANSSLTVDEIGAGLDIDAIKTQKARPDGHIEVPPGAMDKFKFVEHDKQIAHMREMQSDAALHIQQRGPNASLMGTQTNAPSGRAIRANQEGGVIEGKRPRDRYNSLKVRVYKALWQRVRQYCDEETWITVTDDEQAVKSVGFNRQITMQEKLVEGAKKEGMAEEEIQQRLQALSQDPEYAPQLQMPTTVNVPAEMDVNIIIEASTESVTMAQESFEMLAARPDVPLPMLIEFWPGSAKQKKRMRDYVKKQQAEMAAAQEQQQKIAADNLMADTEAKRAKAMKDISQADQADAQTRQTQTETAHTQVVGPYGPPEAVDPTTQQPAQAGF